MRRRSTRSSSRPSSRRRFVPGSSAACRTNTTTSDGWPRTTPGRWSSGRPIAERSTRLNGWSPIPAWRRPIDSRTRSESGSAAGRLAATQHRPEEATGVIEQSTARTVQPELPTFRSKVDRLRPTYGFEDVSLAPGIETVEPSDVELGQRFCGLDLAIPVIASAMDAVVDPTFAGALARLGGLAILNLEGVQTRYEDPHEILEQIAGAPDDQVHDVLARAYAPPIQDGLVARRIEELHA